MPDHQPHITPGHRWLIFWILATGYILVFFHRLCPAIVAVDMMHDLHADGTLVGFLGSAYFYPYALMQIPSGLLSDTWGPRRSISLFLIFAAAGSLLLGMAPTPALAIAGRVLVGLGVSTLFVSTLKALSNWFHAREFAVMTGIFMAMGGLGSLMAAGPLAYLSAWLGWRNSFILVGLLTLAVATLVWLYVRDNPPGCDMNLYPPSQSDPGEIPLKQGAGMVVLHPSFWPLAAWFFFNCAIFFSFVGLWGGPYLMQIYGMGKAEAGQILSLAAIGLMIGSPLQSFLSDRIFRGRKVPLIVSSICAAVLMALLAFFTNSLPVPILCLICFGTGATAGAAVVIAFTATKELFPLRIAGTATGLVNLFPFAGGAIFQPLLGAVLEQNGRSAGNYTVSGYHQAFLVLFICGTLAVAASLLVRETLQSNSRQ